jgi:hypothetical protein
LAADAKNYTLVHSMKNTQHQRDLDGCPNYVRAWCRKAEVGTMQRGYRDVGYLLAPDVLDFRPHQTTRGEWRNTVTRLQEVCLSGNAQEVLAWCRESYPGLLRVIPRNRHGEFVAGVIEGVWGGR